MKLISHRYCPSIPGNLKHTLQLSILYNPKKYSQKDLKIKQPIFIHKNEFVNDKKDHNNEVVNFHNPNSTFNPMRGK